ncbi:hypothetical protein ABB37_10067 [Leptomonas pyrrhocoris]|uniref:Uncharacterized protein n=1 Tax=Leptomonas pyrrhocoris TaxID=157538 RepID=A0A0M9FP23_LEPPY|nr:hypothetical protein ABB37_10067 [Leptomonas pyrrhocoris]KPA73165.1 hypothetical protein ABB37_10067 [Leptomonas pyrrhocoris]|eukprot:XP_015651604.1 hypothetical protein ABB37_10067 [Leptomonas pyrrhocoris]
MLFLFSSVAFNESLLGASLSKYIYVVFSSSFYCFLVKTTRVLLLRCRLLLQMQRGAGDEERPDCKTVKQQAHRCVLPSWKGLTMQSNFLYAFNEAERIAFPSPVNIPSLTCTFFSPLPIPFPSQKMSSFLFLLFFFQPTIASSTAISALLHGHGVWLGSLRRDKSTSFLTSK